MTGNIKRSSAEARMYQNKKFSPRPGSSLPLEFPPNPLRPGARLRAHALPSAAQLGTCLCTLLLAFGLVSGSWGGPGVPEDPSFPGVAADGADGGLTAQSSASAREAEWGPFFCGCTVGGRARLLQGG